MARQDVRVMSVRRRLEAGKVIPAWPAVGDACICAIVDHIDPQLAEQVMDPKLCYYLPRIGRRRRQLVGSMLIVKNGLKM